MPTTDADKPDWRAYETIPLALARSGTASIGTGAARPLHDHDADLVLLVSPVTISLRFRSGAAASVLRAGFPPGRPLG